MELKSGDMAELEWPLSNAAMSNCGGEGYTGSKPFGSFFDSSLVLEDARIGKVSEIDRSKAR